ncbi:MAG TPA: CmpA/NrtA family ABC transporter substrate-binding protein [Opitutaceae bacterium]|nr:CmpA/NrtA family ABC transporter substrate-binding protein [Opitutaceae bacterium]
MPTSSLAAPTFAARPAALRIGFLALTDAAPFAVAEELGLFARRGLRVELRREIGWATIREKIIYGELDAAQAPAPMLWSAQLGLGCPACDVLTALVLNLHGNALTLSRALREAGVRDAASLRIHARDRRARQPLTFGVVFPFSSHHLLLRDWLRAAGFDPEREVRIVVVPPAQMFRNLAAGTIDGFCSGEPWNSLAVREDIGWCPTWSAAQQPGHLEKVLLVTHRFAEARRAEHAALIAALIEACAWCDEPQNREKLADLLADARYLNLPARVIAPTLTGRFDCGHGRIESVPDFHVFHRGDANLPSVAKAAALQRALGAAGLLSPEAAANPELPRKLFREDLHRDALHQHHLHEQATSPDLRGVARA